MDVTEKIINALREPLKASYIRLEDEDGISGFVVSPVFNRMSSLDRQYLIDETLRNASPRLTEQERRQVLMIAALTPAEYDAVGVRIRVYKITETAEGGIEVILDGGYSDAEYVRGALNNQKGVKTTDPEQRTGGAGTLMAFRAKGTGANRMTKAKVLRVLKDDPYIEVQANA